MSMDALASLVSRNCSLMMDLPVEQATHQLYDPHIERKEFSLVKTRIWSGCYAATFRTQKRLLNPEGTSTQRLVSIYSTFK
jgi:hypothetical protein